MPTYIGPRGWVPLRLDVGNVDWDEVAELVHGDRRKMFRYCLGSRPAPH